MSHERHRDQGAERVYEISVSGLSRFGAENA